MRKYTRYLLLALFSIFCMTTWSCESVEKEVPKKEDPFAGLSLSVSVPHGVISLEEWKELSREWETRTKVPVTFYEQPAVSTDDPEGRKYLEHLKEVKPQLLITSWGYKPLLVNEKILNTLPANAHDQNQLDWNDYFIGLKRNACNLYEQPAFIPLSLSTYKLFYRKDLLDKAKLSPPENWDEFFSLVSQKEKWAQGKSILFPLNETEREKIVLSIMIPYVVDNESLSFTCDFISGESKTGHPGFLKSFETLEKINKIISPQSADSGSKDCLKKILNGEAAMVISNEKSYYQLIQNKENVSRGEEVMLGITSVPSTKDVYDPLRKTWTKISLNNVNTVTVIDNNSYGACTTTFLPEDYKQSTNIRMAASNLLKELIQSGIPDSQGRSVLSPVRTSDLTSNVGTLPEIFSFEEQTDILKTIEFQLNNKVFYSPALIPHDKFDLLFRDISNKLVKGSSAVELAQELDKRNAELIKSITPATARKYYRAQLGLSISETE